MLNTLFISNIVLIDKLNIDFDKGLNVITGETGAGKSILLDALSLVLGAHSDTGLIRHGCDSATVIAEFFTTNQDIIRFLEDNSIETENNIVTLKRVLHTDGRNKCYINDTYVSLKILKQVGDKLVEIHGQFSNHSLLNTELHIQSLDSFSVMQNEEFLSVYKQVQQYYYELHKARAQLQKLQSLIATSASEQDYLQFNIQELENLEIKPDEETTLNDTRNNILNAKKHASILQEAVDIIENNGNSIESQIYSVIRILERIKGDNQYSKEITELYEIADSIARITNAIQPEQQNTTSIDEIEDRLFTIRKLARKHNVPANYLSKKLEDMRQQLNIINNYDEELNKLTKELESITLLFNTNAKQLTDLRNTYAECLRNELLKELPDLKLNSADFKVEILKSDDSAMGQDRVTFMIKTNPGMPFAPINKIASGGELSRFMLALRVVLNNTSNIQTLIFDEVDTGISGATASAVGKKLKQLSKNTQLLVITHSAQVAGFADKHFKISKQVNNDTTITNIKELDSNERINEIARIISGEKITKESLASAENLIKTE
ncbi:MAG: DNA repair protein RecN [Alphaproteobacteria bacterium]|nr:DNA repair protein RecN [Alphaproteobacteria bacterium]